MKRKNVLKLLLMAIVSISLYSPLHAQSEKQQKKAEAAALLSSAMDEHRYIFKAQSMVPMTGFTRQLNGEYDLTISTDAINSFLPYMGRIYMPPMDPSQGPLRFTSKDFEYNTQRTKNNGWEISIKPKDVNSVRQMNLSVAEDGNATLQVSGNDRQPITFYGYVTENE
ncbi:MAG: DUF4251 domain-containing protein [Agriterribacter sp.]